MFVTRSIGRQFVENPKANAIGDPLSGMNVALDENGRNGRIAGARETQLDYGLIAAFVGDADPIQKGNIGKILDDASFEGVNFV